MSRVLAYSPTFYKKVAVATTSILTAIAMVLSYISYMSDPEDLGDPEHLAAIILLGFNFFSPWITSWLRPSIHRTQHISVCTATLIFTARTAADPLTFTALGCYAAAIVSGHFISESLYLPL